MARPIEIEFRDSILEFKRRLEEMGLLPRERAEQLVLEEAGIWEAGIGASERDDDVPSEDGAE
jgi:hypothetical protein